MDAKRTDEISVESGELGNFVEEYGATSLSPALKNFWAYMIIGLLGAGILVVGALITGEHLDGRSRTVLLLLGAGLALAGVATLWKWFRRPGTSFLLYENGFVHRFDRVAKSYRWVEIAAVDHTETEHVNRRGDLEYGIHTFLIRTTSGEEVALSDEVIGNGEALGRTIMREVRRTQQKMLLKQALSLEAAGEKRAAIAVIEQLLRESPYNELADQVREHLQRLNDSGPSPEPQKTAIKEGQP